MPLAPKAGSLFQIFLSCPTLLCPDPKYTYLFTWTTMLQIQSTFLHLRLTFFSYSFHHIVNYLKTSAIFIFVFPVYSRVLRSNSTPDTFYNNFMQLLFFWAYYLQHLIHFLKSTNTFTPFGITALPYYGSFNYDIKKYQSSALSSWIFI